MRSGGAGLRDLRFVLHSLGCTARGARLVGLREAGAAGFNPWNLIRFVPA
jgi:hypothetical protein